VRSHFPESGSGRAAPAGAAARGALFLAYRGRSILGDDMGLGKTLEIIALLLFAPRTGGPTLVVCPTSVVGNWRHELARFAPDISVLVHHGAERASGEHLVRAAAEHDVVLSTYSLLHRDEAMLTQVKWDGLVLDEAQKVKNASSPAAQAARAIGARWRVALTGTPVENRLADLWSIFQVINPGYLGSAEEFRREFALPIERASDADATTRLKALTAPFVLRRVKTDRSVIADLPDKQEMKVYCSLTREQATLYEAVLQDTMRQIAESEGIQRRGLVLALLTRLKQVCNHPALLMHDGSPLAGRSGKLARLREMLEDDAAEHLFLVGGGGHHRLGVHVRFGHRAQRQIGFGQPRARRQLARQHLGERDHCGLGGVVRKRAAGFAAVDRTDVDDGAAASLLHLTGA